MWPEIKAAEDEVIARIKNTCDKLGVEVLLINTAGFFVEGERKKITSNDVDFVIHLHFETPKTYDAFSFVALWNPLQFYFDWGYRKYSNNILSHDDFLSCDSECANDHVRRQILFDKTHLKPHFELFHSLSTPVYEPNLGKQKLFYVGINWEKLGKGKGRHQDLLQSLDKTGDLVIYGPQRFLDVDVWEGFDSYAGPLPFDGKSVIDAIHQAGITLVLSSEPHIESELMSNRLFEGLAAGSIIIVDENKFAQKHFGDTLLYIETEGVSPEQITLQVQDHIQWVKKHQNQAISMAMKAQKIFKEKFEMSLSIKKIYDELPQRKQLLAESFLHQTTQYSLTVIGFLGRYSEDNLNSVLDNFYKQTYGNKKLFLLVDKYDYAQNKSKYEAVTQANDAIKLKCVKLFKSDEGGLGRYRIGKIISEMIVSLNEGELVSVLMPNESLFSEHFSSLVRAFEDNRDIDIAYSNVLLTHKDASQKQYFTLSEQFSLFTKNYDNPNGFSRFLFKVKHDDWMFCALKYMGWGFMDAICMKAKNLTRIHRASCLIDIQSQPYQPKDMELFERDLELLRDVMTDDEKTEFANLYVQDIYMDNTQAVKTNIPGREERIYVRLFDSLGLPLWARNRVRNIYRSIIK